MLSVLLCSRFSFVSPGAPGVPVHVFTLLNMPDVQTLRNERTTKGIQTRKRNDVGAKTVVEGEKETGLRLAVTTLSHSYGRIANATTNLRGTESGTLSACQTTIYCWRA